MFETTNQLKFYIFKQPSIATATSSDPAFPIGPQRLQADGTVMDPHLGWGTTSEEKKHAMTLGGKTT